MASKRIFKVKFSQIWKNDYKNFFKNSQSFKRNIDKVVVQLCKNPFQKKLKTYKVKSKKFGMLWCTPIFHNSDLGILWDFSKDKKYINIYAFG